MRRAFPGYGNAFLPSLVLAVSQFARSNGLRTSRSTANSASTVPKEPSTGLLIDEIGRGHNTHANPENRMVSQVESRISAGSGTVGGRSAGTFAEDETEQTAEPGGVEVEVGATSDHDGCEPDSAYDGDGQLEERLYVACKERLLRVATPEVMCHLVGYSVEEQSSSSGGDIRPKPHELASVAELADAAGEMDTMSVPYRWSSYRLTPKPFTLVRHGLTILYKIIPTH